MSLQSEKPENENKAANPEPVNQQEQAKDNLNNEELSEEALDEVGGGYWPVPTNSYVPAYPLKPNP